MKLFRRLSGAMSRTRDNLTGRLRELMGTGRRVDESLLEELEEILLGADLGWQLTDEIVNGLRDRIKTDAETPIEQLIEEELLLQIENSHNIQDPPAVEGPRVILVVGVNGAGKTTTIGKLAARLSKDGNKVLLAAADTFRAAAIEQLEAWAGRAEVELVKSSPGADPASVAFDALGRAMARGHDVLLVDTAGRLHNKKNLMLELEKISRVVGKRMPGAPHEVLLVLDGTTGQNALQQARLFSESTGVTGLVISKLDGTARGGIALSIHRELGLPIRWIGVGEKLDDLQPFVAQEYARALFEGLGAEEDEDLPVAEETEESQDLAGQESY